MRHVSVYFNGLTDEELSYFLDHIRPKITVEGGELTGSGCHLPTNRYDISIDPGGAYAWLRACLETEPNTMMLEKPCHSTGFCPYGPLVEAFPILAPEERDLSISCRNFGHKCPVFYCGEQITEEPTAGPED